MEEVERLRWGNLTTSVFPTLEMGELILSYGNTNCETCFWKARRASCLSWNFAACIAAVIFFELPPPPPIFPSYCVFPRKKMGEKTFRGAYAGEIASPPPLGLLFSSFSPPPTFAVNCAYVVGTYSSSVWEGGSGGNANSRFLIHTHAPFFPAIFFSTLPPFPLLPRYSKVILFWRPSNHRQFSTSAKIFL